MAKHNFWLGLWEITHKDKFGNILFQEELRNALADEGENSMLDSYFRNQNNPVQYYLRLCNDSLDETDTLASILGEPAGSGYIPQLIERSSVGFPIIELDAGDWRVISKETTFTAFGGDIGPVVTAYLATTIDNTGKLIAYVPLSMTRTILDGDSLIAKLKIKLK
jgi:hypothetical protein